MTTLDRIDSYANSMFRYERLADGWIESCAAYLRQTFGSSVDGKTVVDYAFGRGNWSLAFLRAGAGRVIAVDAAESNVRRFSDYCREQAVTNVTIVHGDVTREPLGQTGDLVWLYGILHHIPAAQAFLERIRDLCHPGGLVFVYAYNRGSLRQFVVETAREAVLYTTEDEYRADSPLFVRPARRRARDDLTAPHIAWYGTSQLADLARASGLHVTARVPDFHTFRHGSPSEEFQPHHWICTVTPHAVELPEPAELPHAGDIRALDELADLAWLHFRDDAKRKAAIGLFNTHFAALGKEGRAGPAIVEDFLFLVFQLLAHDVAPDALPEPTALLYAATLAAAGGEHHAGLDSLPSSVLRDHILSERILF